MKNVLPFLKDLMKNNDHDWFQHNRSRYLEAKGEFDEFIGHLIP
jgi:uncharacterized protein (DUF2461 family)